MEAALAASRDHADLAAGAPAILRVVLAAENFEFGNGIHAGIVQQCEVGPAVEVIGAVNRPVVLCGAIAVDGDVDLVGEAGEARDTDLDLVARKACGDPRHEGSELDIVPVFRRSPRTRLPLISPRAGGVRGST